jgi:hypothetical protein
VIHAQDILDEVAAEYPSLLTISHLMALFHWSRRHCYRVIKLRGWPVVQDRPGSPLLIPRQVVIEYLAERLGG